jgi:Cft2 family RNA processing exonuclease
MSKVNFNIISTGSQGNAVIIENSILIDCGVPFKLLEKHIKPLKLVLLTHIHSDHFNKTTIRRLALERPTLRFACGEWLVAALVDCGVPKRNIDPLKMRKSYNYKSFKVEAFPLTHNAKNCGFKLYLPTGKLIYATDTNSLDGIEAKGFDLYMIEANYMEDEIRERIAQKELNGEYAYERRVLQNHLSKEKCDRFIINNIESNGEYVYMHAHNGEVWE